MANLVSRKTYFILNENNRVIKKPAKPKMAESSSISICKTLKNLFIFE